MRTAMVVLALCALAVASVVRDRRALPPDAQKAPKNTTGMEICAPSTPCNWAVYNVKTKIIETNLTNTYCICSSDLECVQTEDDPAIFSYIFRCREPITKDSNSTTRTSRTRKTT